MKFRKDQFNKEGRSFFDNLFNSRNSEIIKVLAHIFPYVENYINNRSLIDGNYEDSSLYKSANLQSRVSSVKYFDLYFSYNSNDFLGISKLYSSFYSRITQNELSQIPKAIEDCFNKLPKEFHREFFEKMWLNQNDFEEQQNYPILIGLKNIVLKISTDSGFLVLSPFRRATAIMANLFSLISVKQKECFINSISKDYRYLYALYQMTLWLDKDNDKESIEIINKTLEEMFWAISDNTINLYTDSFYVRNNIWAFVWIKKRILNLDETVEIRDYINRVFEKRIV